MYLRSIICIAFCVIGAASGLCAEGQQRSKPSPARAVSTEPSFVRLTQQELALILSDLTEANAQVLKRLKEDPEFRHSQLENLKQLLALARQAQKEGLSSDPTNSHELNYIRDEVVALNYDRQINKGKEPAPPFTNLSQDRLSAYWGESTGKSIPASLKTSRQAKFDEFFETKVSLLKAANPALKDQAITDEQKLQARDFYTKVQLTMADYAAAKILPLSFREKINLQVKLQRAQFLARLYSERIAAMTVASADDIATYLKAHPELDTSAKRTKANQILGRAKSGEDFAKLANEFSDDPGNKNEQNGPQGGLYRNVNLGVMVPTFEQAAMALEAGQISPALVESDFGFHIIKLERKGRAAGPDSPETYDVRHILISTSVDNPANPGGRPIPVLDYVKGEIEAKKEQRLIDQLVIENKISVPEDFTIPAAAEAAASPARVATPKTRAARKRK